MKIFKNFIDGIGYIFRGVSYFASKKELWKYIVIPLLINLTLLSISLALLTGYIGNITEYFRNLFGLIYRDTANTIWYFKILFFLYNLAIWIIKFVVGILAFIVWGIILFVIAQIVTSPFYDTLSEKVEKIERPDYIEIPFARTVKLIPRILSAEICKMGILIAVPLTLMFFNLIPGIGEIIYLILSFMFTSVTYAFSFTDYSQARKNESLGKRMGFAKKNFFTLLGFGLPVFIPFLNIFITPFMVTGGTLLYLNSGGQKKAG